MSIVLPHQLGTFTPDSYRCSTSREQSFYFQSCEEVITKSRTHIFGRERICRRRTKQAVGQTFVPVDHGACACQLRTFLYLVLPSLSSSAFLPQDATLTASSGAPVFLIHTTLILCFYDTPNDNVYVVKLGIWRSYIYKVPAAQTGVDYCE